VSNLKHILLDNAFCILLHILLRSYETDLGDSQILFYNFILILKILKSLLNFYVLWMHLKVLHSSLTFPLRLTLIHLLFLFLLLNT